jgi:HAE1 family hydrophobic/amphiphilic exporter-1
MSLSELSVKRPVTGVMIFLALTVLGVFTFSRLKLDMYPDIEFPVVAVIAQYPGADPESIEELVTKPIEEAMASVENVEDTNSTSNQGSSVTLVKFAWGSDMQKAENDVRKNLEVYALDQLPEAVDRPLTFAFDPSLQPVVFMSVQAAGGPEVVRRLAKDAVEPYLARIPGVAAAEVIGGAEREIRVELLPEWLQAYNISPSQVVQALRGANVIFPGGRIDQGGQELAVSTNAEFTSLADINNTVIGMRGTKEVLVRDVARVIDGFEEDASVVRANGKTAVLMAIRKQSDANTVEVARRVVDELKEIELRLPEGTELTPLFNQADAITRSVSNLSSSAYLAVFLTAAVLLAFLRSWRTSSIILVSIPLSMLATFAVMDFQQVTMNIISMAGLALAVGMVVDNAIVVLENIFVHISKGEDRKTAAIKGAQEMAMPVTASTLTTVVVFAPILFVPGIAGQMFRDMSLTICFALISSLVISLSLVPLMASLILRKSNTRFERLVGRLTAWLDPLSERYARMVRWAIIRPKRILLGAVGVFIFSLALSPLAGVDFMPKVDDSMLRFEVKAAPGTAVGESERLFMQAEEVIHRIVPEAEVVVSQFGGGEGFAALFGQNSYSGNISVRLPERSERERHKVVIENELRDHFAKLAGLEIRPQAQGFGGEQGDVAIKLFGDNLAEVQGFGEKLKSKLETMEGVADPVLSLQRGQPELSVRVDREQLRVLGLSAGQVAAEISTYFLGTPATEFREDGDEFRVFVRAPKDVRKEISNLRALPITTPRGMVVPLETVADIRQSIGPTGITRENQQRLATISLSSGGRPLGELVAQVDEAIAEIGKVPGINVVVAGTAEDMKESFAALGLAILVAILLVYMVMASQFESLLEPFVLLASIPLAMSGIMFALVISQTPIQVTVLIGMILLAGIVVNNGIVLIDVLKIKRDRGEDLVDAAELAGRERLRPILMTTATTVLGMVPLAFELGDGAELWAPMARAVIGGMLVSTALTLLVVPVAYVRLATFVDARRAKKQRKVAAEAA